MIKRIENPQNIFYHGMVCRLLKNIESNLQMRKEHKNVYNVVGLSMYLV